MTMRIAIVGMGKMGKAISELAPSRGWEVTARLGAWEMNNGITRDDLNGADVAVEFTVPHATPSNIRALVGVGCPVVAGTTGWFGELPAIGAEVEAARGSRERTSHWE